MLDKLPFGINMLIVNVMDIVGQLKTFNELQDMATITLVLIRANFTFEQIVH